MFYWLESCETFKSNELIKVLIEWLVPACIEFIESNSATNNSNNGDCYYVNRSCFVKNMMQLTHIMLDNVLNIEEKDVKTVNTWIQATFVQIAAWAIGSLLIFNAKIKFDEFYKQLWKGQNKHYPLPRTMEKPEISIPQEGTIFDYYYIYKQRGTWKCWPDVVKNEKIHQSSFANEIIVPTIDTIRYSNLIKAHIKCHYPVLLLGSSQTGKTLLIHHLLINEIDKNRYDVTFMNFNRTLTPADVQHNIILSKLIKKNFGHYATWKNKTGLIFIDDLNLISHDTLEQTVGIKNHPIIELLRQHFDHKTSYDFKNLHKIFLSNNLNFICSYTTNNGNLSISRRFLRHFSILSINELADDAIVKIYSSILFMSWKQNSFPNDMLTVAGTIALATVQLYQSVRNQLKPTLNRAHYIFNLNDYSKVIQGCAKLKKDTYDADKRVYFKLWLHEICRTFRDRIINSDDETIFMNILRKVIKDNFNDEISENDEQQSTNDINIDKCLNENLSSILFANLNDKNDYEQMSLEQMKEIFLNYLKEYNKDKSEGKLLDIVFFDYAVIYLSKICRVLNAPSGHSLLIGYSGSGRQVLIKLACYIYNHLLIKATNYSDDNENIINKYRNDMKVIVKKAGGENKQCVLLSTHLQLIRPHYMSVIDYILKNNELSNLYDIDEKQEILKLVRLSAHQTNRNFDATAQTVFLHFSRRCKANLKIFLLTNPLNLRHVINNLSFACNVHIIWFDNWPQESYHSLASHFIAATNIDIDVKEKLAKVCPYFHQHARDVLANADQTAPEAIHISSTFYLHMLNLFNDLVRRKQASIMREKNKYLMGLEKLSFAASQILAMQKALAEYQPQLEEMTQKATEMTKQIALETIQVENASALVRKDEKIAHEQAAVAQVLKLECEQDLAQAIPILEDAISALNTLKPSDITLVKSMKNPPDAIKLVMAAVCVIKDVRPDRIPDPSTGRKTIDYWGPSKRILGDMNFLQSLKDFDKDHIKPDIMVKIRKEYLPHKDFKPHVVAKASSAAEGLCKWIIAMDMYDKVAKEVAPKKEKLEKAEREYANTMAILNQKKEQVARIEEKLAALNLLLDDATRKQQKLQAQVDLCNRKLNRAQKLIGGLSGEKMKWTEACEKLQNEFNCLPGDILLSSAFIAYLSPFQDAIRTDAISLWANYVKTNNIPTTDSFAFMDILNMNNNTPSDIDVYLMNGLPHYDNYIANAFIQKYSHRNTLLIDPQRQAFNWIQNTERMNKIKIVKFTQSNYLQTFRDAAVYGYPVLLDVQEYEIPICFYPFLSKWFGLSCWKKTNNSNSNNSTSCNDAVTGTCHTSCCTPDIQVQLEFNNETINLHRNFKLYITACRMNNIAEDVWKMVTVINFQLTEPALTIDLTRIVMEIEKPEYKKLQNDLIRDECKYRNELIALDNKILVTLSRPGTDILEDEQGMQVLDDSRHLASTIMEKQNTVQLQQQLIINYKANYLNFARHSANLFFVIDKLQSIQCMYKFSLNWYKELYVQSILNAEKSECFRKRCESLIRSLTYDLYKNVTRSLFEKDKLLFSFSLCISILTLRGEIKNEEYAMFLKGPDCRFAPTLDAASATAAPYKEILKNPLGNLLLADVVWWSNFSQIENIAVFRGLLQSFIANDINDWKCIFQGCNIGFPAASDDLNPFTPDSVIVEKSSLPAPWSSKLNHFHILLLLRFANSNYLYINIVDFIEKSIGKQFTTPLNFNIDEAFNESFTLSPIIFMLSGDSDPTEKILALASRKKLENKFKKLSLGYNQELKANQVLEKGQRLGWWVLLENCHLAPAWLKQLDEKIESMHSDNTHEDFRIWLTTEVTPHFPLTLLQNSIKIIDDVKQSLKQNFSKLYEDEPISNQNFFNSCPENHETFTRTIYAISCFHTAILERNKYNEFHWDIPYNINKSNFVKSLFQLQQFVLSNADAKCHDVKNFLTFFLHCNYSQLLHTEWNERLFETLINNYLNINAIKASQRDKFSQQQKHQQSFTLPWKSDYQDYMNHIRLQLPDALDNPGMVGLHNSVVCEYWKNSLFALLSAVQHQFTNAAGALDDESQILNKIQDIANFMASLSLNCQQQQEDLSKCNYTYILNREIDKYKTLLKEMNFTVNQLEQAYMGYLPITASVETTTLQILRNQLPVNWALLSPVCHTNKLSYFLVSLKSYIMYLNDLNCNNNGRSGGTTDILLANCWLEAFFQPKAFILHAKLSYARKCLIPFKDIQFQFGVNSEELNDDKKDYIIALKGLYVLGARWDREANCLTEIDHILCTQMPLVIIRAGNNSSSTNLFKCPLFKTIIKAPLLLLKEQEKWNGGFNEILHLQGKDSILPFVSLPTNMAEEHWIKRGVKLLCHNLAFSTTSI